MEEDRTLFNSFPDDKTRLLFNQEFGWSLSLALGGSLQTPEISQLKEHFF